MTPRVAISALFALDGCVLGGWMSHIPEAQRNLNLTTGQLGSILLCSSAGAILAMPLSGTLVHRYGSRRVSIVTAVLVLLIIPFLLRASTPAALAVTLFAMGASNGTLDIAMNNHAMAIQTCADRPILSSVHGWWCVGLFLGGVGTAVANAIHAAPQDHLIFASVVLFALLNVAIPGLLPDETDQGEEGARFVLPRGRLLALGLLTLVALFAEGALGEWSAIYFRNDLKTSATVAALGFGAGAASMALGRLTGDPFVARLGPTKALQISGYLTAAGILLGTAWPHPLAAFLGFALAGLGLANCVPILFAAAADVPGVSSSAGIAAVANLGYAAFLGGPPLIGNLAQVTTLRLSLAAVGLLTIIIGLTAPRVLQGEKGETRSV